MFTNRQNLNDFKSIVMSRCLGIEYLYTSVYLLFRCMVGLVYDIQAQKSVIVYMKSGFAEPVNTRNGYDSCACLCFII